MTLSPPKRVEVWGAAKINVGWRVGARRPDGYHDVCGLLHTISLADRLEITTGSGEIPVRVVVPGHPELEDRSNLVCAVGALLAERLGMERSDSLRTGPPPTTVVVHKSIPVAAGLGGGSADAAAALVGLNTVWRAGRTAGELLAMGAEVGSDVPGILLGGLVHVSGRGERVRNRGAATGGWFVLGVGPERISSADAYAAFDAATPAERPAHLHHNDLEEAACALAGDLAGRLDAMRRAAGIAFVAGSGPTVVGVAADEAHARDVAARVRNTFTDVVLAQPIDWGVRMSVSAGRRN